MKGNYLLTGDLHLTDNPIDEYRWSIFKTLTTLSIENNVSTIYLLGDTSDRKDRHSSSLVNRLVDSLVELHTDTGAEVIILLGNHDAPIQGVPFWRFLTGIPGVDYIDEPTFDIHKEFWLLPFSANPAVEWRELNLSQAKAIFMHQTLAGSIVDGGRVIQSSPHPMPILPRGIHIFSGDVHHPQQVGPVTYVGAPYPVRFSETWRNRVILLKNGSDKLQVKEIFIPSVKRCILDIASSEKLPEKFKEGDQLRIRYKLNSQKMTQWPVEQEKIKKWANERGIAIISIEAILIDEVKEKVDDQNADLSLMQPDDVILNFSKDENLSDELTSVGIQLMREAVAA